MDIDTLLSGSVDLDEHFSASQTRYRDEPVKLYNRVDWQQGGLSGVRKGSDCYDGVCV